MNWYWNIRYDPSTTRVCSALYQLKGSKKNNSYEYNIKSELYKIILYTSFIAIDNSRELDISTAHTT